LVAERIEADGIKRRDRPPPLSPRVARPSKRTVVVKRVARFLPDRHGLGAMSRAHREIIHLARLLRRLADGLPATDIDHYLIRDAQRIIESIEALVRIHNAQEEDIYEQAIQT
jgi:hypothetical protein